MITLVLFVVVLPVFVYISNLQTKLKEIVQLHKKIENFQLRLNDIERTTYGLYDSETENLHKDVKKLSNIIYNLALYTQNDSIGPHNIDDFLDILANNNKNKFDIIIEDEFKKYKKNKLKCYSPLKYNEEYSEQKNKQRMWVSTNINEIIYSTLRSKFEPIIDTGPIDFLFEVD